MRKVKIQYRCSVCGTEVRMTLATDEATRSARYRQEDMELVAPIEWIHNGTGRAQVLGIVTSL